MILTNRVKKIILDPKLEWAVIVNENTTLRDLLKFYIFPLSLISAIASFIGYSFIGQTAPIIGNYASVSMGISYALLAFLSTMLFFPITVVVLDALSMSFESEKSINKTAQLVAFSYTPALVAGIFNIIPSLSFIGSWLGLYSFYLMYLGIGPLKNTPEEKKISYIAVSIIIVMVIMVCVHWGLSFIFSAVGLTLKPSLNYSSLPS